LVGVCCEKGVITFHIFVYQKLIDFAASYFLVHIMSRYCKYAALLIDSEQEKYLVHRKPRVCEKVLK